MTIEPILITEASRGAGRHLAPVRRATFHNATWHADCFEIIDWGAIGVSVSGFGSAAGVDLSAIAPALLVDLAGLFKNATFAPPP